VKRTFRSVGLALVSASPLALAAPATAGTLASSTLMGKGTATELVRCSVTQLGKKQLAIERVAIVSNAGVELVLQVDSCSTAPLAPRVPCYFSAGSGVSEAYGVIELRGSAKNVRGLCQVLDNADGSVASESELR
jgi:hypothetical protein